MSTDIGDLICEMADRDSERPPAPGWWEGTQYPTCEQITKSADPVRTFERALDGNADRAWSCYMLVEDTLTAHGIERSDVLIRAESNGEGLTST